MTAARKSAPKRRPSKKRTKKSKSPANGASAEGADTGPVEMEIDDETLRYKLKALQLEWEREDVRVRQEIQSKLNDILARAQRNDQKWKRATEARKKAVNEAIDALTETLPEGYAITNVKLAEGTYRAVYDPESRGQHVQ